MNIQEKIDMIKKYSLKEDIKSLLNYTNSRICCEVGVRWGNNLFNMASADSVSEIYGIDIWKETGNPAQNDVSMSQKDLDNAYNYVCLKSKQEFKNVKIIKGFSTEVCKDFPDCYFDYIFIDADHSYEGCKADLCSWWSKVKLGGILSGDDYTNSISKNGVKFGVIEAVNEFVGENSLHETFYENSSLKIKIGCPYWFIVKNKI